MTGQQGLALGVGFLLGLAGMLVWGRRAGRPRLPFEGGLRRTLANELGVARGAAVLQATREFYFQLRAATPSRSDPVLQKHIDTNILTGLALYKALQAEIGDRQVAYQQVERILVDVFRIRLQLPIRMLNRLPDPYPLFRRAVHARMRTDFPEAGWRTEWVEDSQQAVAFNLHTCLYLDTLRGHGAAELTPIFCYLDDVMMQGADFVRWERTQTLGRGDVYCNFRWVRVD